MTTLRITRPAQIVAAAAQMLRFRPDDDAIVVPMTRSIPWARLDHPHTPQDTYTAAATLADAYTTHPGQIILLSVTDDHDSAAALDDALSAELHGAATQIVAAIRVDLDTGAVYATETGDVLDQVTPEIEDQIAARAVLAGHRQPAQDRTTRAHNLIGDGTTTPVRQSAMDSAALATGHPKPADRDIPVVLTALSTAQATGNLLSEQHAARVLVGITRHQEVRDAILSAMTHHSAAAQVAIWSDLVKRAPERTRTTAALILAFACWLNGDGAGAWIAHDHADAGPDNSLANLISHMLTAAMPPHAWTEFQTNPDQA